MSAIDCSVEWLEADGLGGFASGTVSGIRIRRYHALLRSATIQRDGSYHRGTVWPWLIGPFVEGWVRVHGNTAKSKAEARARFLPPLYQHLHRAGAGHISEICDAEPPHRPRGGPFQAWSLGEFIRLERSVL